MREESDLSRCLDQTSTKPILVAPFNTFTNAVCLTKSRGSGLSLNISGDPFIINRPILISYVSIVTTRYLRGRSRSAYHCMLTQATHSLVRSTRGVHRSLASVFLYSSLTPDRPRSAPCFFARSRVQGEDEVNQTRGQMHATTRIPAVHSEMITLTHPVGRYHQRGTSNGGAGTILRGPVCLLARSPAFAFTHTSGHERTLRNCAPVGAYARLRVGRSFNLACASAIRAFSPPRRLLNYLHHRGR